MSYRQQQVLANTQDVMERTTASIQRSNELAIATEQIGTEVLSELGEQRESLLRTTHRLEDANEDLSRSRVVVNKLRHEVIYNKVVLTLIIIMEIIILLGVIILKFVRL